MPKLEMQGQILMPVNQSTVIFVLFSNVYLTYSAFPTYYACFVIIAMYLCILYVCTHKTLKCSNVQATYTPTLQHCFGSGQYTVHLKVIVTMI